MKHISEILPCVLEDAANPDADLWRCGFDSRPLTFCGHCAQDVPLRLSKSGPHVRGDCERCQRFVEFVKQSHIMPFDKHKGQLIKDVPASYLKWMQETPDVWGKLSEARRQIIQKLLAA